MRFPADAESPLQPRVEFYHYKIHYGKGFLVHLLIFEGLMGIPEIDAWKEHKQLIWTDESGLFISVRPGETSFLQSFLEKPETVSIPP